ncbi:MAG: hypothetical protein JWL74_91, partial [Alphaproteobacteria bacterium]|nr:hypothetical protein [Alphaproteobacteria bacterium]
MKIAVPGGGAGLAKAATTGPAGTGRAAAVRAVPGVSPGLGGGVLAA